MAAVGFLLNGEAVSVEQPPAGMTLLDFVRARGLTGAKEGCAEGECGACAVAMVEAESSNRSAYRVVNSCLMLLPMADGREIFTVEALAAEGELLEAQRAMASAGGSQCGYCTPGFVVSLFAEHYRPDRVGRCDTSALSGNLCRCTGYRPIADAAHSLGPAPDDRFRKRLQRPAPTLEAFTIPGFSRPARLEDALQLLRQHPDAKLVAGATDVAVESNIALRRWPHLVSLEAVDELHSFVDAPHAVMIGAGLPLNEIARLWTGAPPAFAEWLMLFASPLVRNRASLGGNLATASPIGDAAPLLMAMDAVVHVASTAGRRAIPLASFFIGYRQTALGPGEIITTVEVPKPIPSRLRFYKVSKRKLDDISTVSAAVAIDCDAAGRVSRARLAFGGVAATPMRAVEAETAVVGAPWNDDAVEQVQRVLDLTLKPMSDHRGSSDYRREVSKRLVEKYQWESRP